MQNEEIIAQAMTEQGVVMSCQVEVNTDYVEQDWVGNIQRRLIELAKSTCLYKPGVYTVEEFREDTPEWAAPNRRGFSGKVHVRLEAHNGL